MTRLVIASFVLVSGLVAAVSGVRVDSALERAQSANLAHRARRQVLEARIFVLGDRLLDEFERSRQLAPSALRSLPGWENQCLDLPARHGGDDELLAWLAAQVTRLEELESQQVARESAVVRRQEHHPVPQGPRAFPRR